jgi:preprotein translocase subunit SecA
MDHLKEGIGLRGYGQKDPLIEYKKESFNIFEAMMQRFEEETLRILFNLEVREGVAPPPRRQTPTFDVRGEEPEQEQEPTAVSNGAAAKSSSSMETSIEEFTRDVRRKKERELAQVSLAGSGGAATGVKQVLATPKVGRNDPCPCGSGKKFKKCCGQTA